MAFKVSQIDHVEVNVPDRYAAADWYRRVFGLEIMREHEDWADDPNGPLMISSDSGNTKIALFKGTPQGDADEIGQICVAFRVSGADFLAMLDHIRGFDLKRRGQPISDHPAKDHGKAWSVTFDDPWSNAYEITTYDYDVVGAQPK